MRISEINRNKVKIVLTKTEMLCCFGTYEKLISMNKNTKTIIKALLREIIEDYYHTQKNKDIFAKIYANKNTGCIIIISAKGVKTPNEYVFEFPNSECLIKACIFLQNHNTSSKNKSMIYKMPKSYRLIIETNKNFDNFIQLQEFLYKPFKGSLHKEYTKEYGKPILTNNAIYEISKAFN